MTVESTISRANREVNRGNLWRAKEILGSGVVTYGRSYEIFRAYANVLARMGDRLEAGKFYLLSVDSPEEAELECIEIFLSRFGHETHDQLLAKFPRRVRRENRDEYPEYFRSHLVGIGAPTILGKCDVRPEFTSNPSRDRMFLFGCAAFAFCIVTCLLVGLGEIISWFW